LLKPAFITQYIVVLEVKIIAQTQRVLPFVLMEVSVMSNLMCSLQSKTRQQAQAFNMQSR
jgi:branched-subunit amino acid transport protein AzlD